MNNIFKIGLVSVIIPIYNRENLVGKTIESVMDQTYKNVEIVAINDGSTDNSLLVLKKYAEKYPEKIFLINQENTGQVKARNKGLVKANGEFIAFLDSDDTWEKEKLALQIPLFRGGVGLVYSGIREVDSAGKEIRTVLCEPEMRGNIYHHLLIKNRMTGGSVVVSRAALQKVGVFDGSFRAAENWDLWIRISREFEVDYVNKSLVNYLKHPGNISQDVDRMNEATRAILNKHLPGLPGDSNSKMVYNKAFAEYHYNLGMYYFGLQNYSKARSSFIKSSTFIFNYRNAMAMFFRTFFGKYINMLLSNIKKIILR